LRKKQPNAGAIIITGQPSVAATINALRAGVIDYLPKPFNSEDLLDRVGRALQRQRIEAKNDKRLSRLRDAVRRLNISRHTVTKKVDLLCNDLITAYGELSKQLDVVRTQEGFRNLLNQSQDLEQMLCHAMDWILRQVGYCNVAIWLASEEHEFELGAYMKYTIAGEPELSDAMRAGLLPQVVREGSMHLVGQELLEHLTPAEQAMLAGQEIMGVNCTYLGESLAAIVGGQVDVGINGYAELSAQIQAGTVQALGISSAERLPGLDVPTLREQGLDLVFENWRSVVAPPGISPADRDRLTRAIDAMVHSQSWREAISRYRWIDRYLPGEAFA